MKPAFVFDELHVISDLHLGGREGFQVFDLGPQLGAYVDRLTAISSRRVGLVVNGDMVDFLAEEPARHFDPEGAEAKLRRIAADAAFSPFFEALRGFLAKPNRTLVVNLGNHDLELALPWVREAFLDVLAGHRAAARGRVVLSFDGTGFLAGVGERRVLCLHGNEVDPWNVTDFERLRRYGVDGHLGARLEAWIPNAGTQMVIDVMNAVKRAHPFIDLLKPEAEAAVPVLLAIDPSQAGKLGGAVRAAARMGFDRLRMQAGFLSAEAEGVDAQAALGFEAAAANWRPRDPEALLAAAQRRLEADVDPMALADSEQSEMLGWGSAAWSRLRGKPRSHSLRDALSGLENDRSFDLDARDSTFRDLDRRVDAEVDVVTAGHTHLERSFERDRGGAYLNSGTWIRLMRLGPDVLASQESFDKVFDLLSQGSMAALDGSGLVLRKPAEVFVTADEGGGVRAELRRIDVGAPGAEPERVGTSWVIGGPR